MQLVIDRLSKTYPNGVRALNEVSLCRHSLVSGAPSHWRPLTQQPTLIASALMRKALQDLLSASRASGVLVAACALVFVGVGCGGGPSKA